MYHKVNSEKDDGWRRTMEGVCLNWINSFASRAGKHADQLPRIAVMYPNQNFNNQSGQPSAPRQRLYDNTAAKPLPVMRPAGFSATQQNLPYGSYTMPGVGQAGGGVKPAPNFPAEAAEMDRDSRLTVRAGYNAYHGQQVGHQQQSISMHSPAPMQTPTPNQAYINSVGAAGGGFSSARVAPMQQKPSHEQENYEQGQVSKKRRLQATKSEVEEIHSVRLGAIENQLRETVMQDLRSHLDDFSKTVGQKCDSFFRATAIEMRTLMQSTASEMQKAQALPSAGTIAMQAELKEVKTQIKELKEQSATNATQHANASLLDELSKKVDKIATDVEKAVTAPANSGDTVLVHWRVVNSLAKGAQVDRVITEMGKLAATSKIASETVSPIWMPTVKLTNKLDKLGKVLPKLRELTATTNENASLLQDLWNVVAADNQVLDELSNETFRIGEVVEEELDAMRTQLDGMAGQLNVPAKSTQVTDKVDGKRSANGSKSPVSLKSSIARLLFTADSRSDDAFGHRSRRRWRPPITSIPCRTARILRTLRVMPSVGVK